MLIVVVIVLLIILYTITQHEKFISKRIVIDNLITIPSRNLTPPTGTSVKYFGTKMSRSPVANSIATPTAINLSSSLSSPTETNMLVIEEDCRRAAVDYIRTNQLQNSNHTLAFNTYNFRQASPTSSETVNAGCYLQPGLISSPYTLVTIARPTANSLQFS